MNFVIDENLPRRLADWLRRAGYQADHVSDLAMLGASDEVIWRAARERDAAIVTRDSDFIEIARRAGEGTVIRLLIGNCPAGVLIARVEQIWPEVEIRLRVVGDRLIELG